MYIESLPHIVAQGARRKNMHIRECAMGPMPIHDIAITAIDY